MPFTKENAAEMARLSHAPDSARFLPKDESDEPAEKPIITAEHAASEAETFRAETVTRVRKHIRLIQERIDSLLDKRSIDTKEMKELADTLKSLEVIEQKLSNRPAPAAAKVSSKPPRRSTEFPSPTPIAE